MCDIKKYTLYILEYPRERKHINLCMKTAQKFHWKMEAS